MASIRERIVREILARAAAAVTPVAVLRQPTAAIPREACPVLVLTVESDAPVKIANDRAERELAVRLTALSRSGADPWDEADRIVCAAHAALMTDTTLGGLALRIQEMDADWLAEDADLEAVAIPAAYRITYRSVASDLTQGG